MKTQRKREMFKELRKASKQRSEAKSAMNHMATSHSHGLTTSSGTWNPGIQPNIQPIAAPPTSPSFTSGNWEYSKSSIPVLPVTAEGMAELAKALGVQPTEDLTGPHIVLDQDGHAYNMVDVMLAFVRFFAGFKACPECNDIFKTDEDDYICRRCRG